RQAAQAAIRAIDVGVGALGAQAGELGGWDLEERQQDGHRQIVKSKPKIFVSTTIATPIRLSPAIKPDAIGIATPSCCRRRMTSPIAEPMNIAMQLLPGITIAIPRPFADGMYGRTSLAANFSTSVSTTPIDSPTRIASFVEYC